MIWKFSFTNARDARWNVETWNEVLILSQGIKNSLQSARRCFAPYMRLTINLFLQGFHSACYLDASQWFGFEVGPRRRVVTKMSFVPFGIHLSSMAPERRAASGPQRVPGRCRGPCSHQWHACRVDSACCDEAWTGAGQG